MRKLLPILLALIGLGGGAGAGLMLRPPPAEEELIANPCGEPDGAAHADADAHGETATEGVPEFVKLNNQFVVPVVEDGRVAALVIMSISLQVKAGASEAVYQREPKLRDGFLQVLFDHANVGGFQGAFTRSGNMDVLRGALSEIARKTLGEAVEDVLIVDIVRQDN